MNLKAFMNEISNENTELKMKVEDLQNTLLYYVNQEIGNIFSRSDFVEYAFLIFK